MNRFLLPIVAAIFLATSSHALDVIHLPDGQSIQCRIDAITDNIVTYSTSVRLPNGRTGTSQRTIPADRVKFIDFGPIPGEKELMAKLGTATVEEIDLIWDKKYRNLHRPKSNTGTIGIALGNALLKKENDFHWKRALELFGIIHKEAWDQGSKNAAKQGRLKTLIRLGELETAITEARQLATETEDATMLIEARYIVARADFEKLKQLEEENPKWEEDDTVRPDRNRLYHTTIDQFLWPYLFHGTKVEVASRGLFAAGEVYQFANKADLAKACFADIVQLYPESEAAMKAQEIFQNFNTTTEPTDDPPETK